MKRYALAFVLAATVLAGCRGGGSDTAEPALEMRVYDVPVAQTEALERTLNNVFADGGKNVTGRVSSPAPGQLVVLAPAGLHGSIEASLRTLAKEQAPQAGSAARGPDTPMRLSFWTVDAVPVDGPDDSSLATLAPALDEARKQLGIVHFELRDHVSGVSGFGQPVERSWPALDSQGTPGAVRQLKYTLRSGSPTPLLELSFADQIPVTRTFNGASSVTFANTGARTTTAVAPGQTLVITQNPVPEGDGSSSVMRLYLVRVDPVASP